MKKYILIAILIGLPLLKSAFAVPNNTMSITPSATDATTITASDENTRNSNVSTPYNAHDHNDIDQTANTLAVGDAAAGNKTITANNADTDKPFLRYDDTYNKWVVSSDGTIVLSLMVATGVSVNQYLPVTDAIGSFTRDLTAASGDTSVTGLSFTPTSVHFLTNVSTATVMSNGFDNISATECLFDYSLGAAGAYDYSTTYSIYAERPALGNNQSAKLASLDTAGFTLSWTKTSSPSGTLTVLYRAKR